MAGAWGGLGPGVEPGAGVGPAPGLELLAMGWKLEGGGGATVQMGSLGPPGGGAVGAAASEFCRGERPQYSVL